MDLARIEFLLTETDRHLVGIQTMIPLLREIKDELQQMRTQMFANHELHNLTKKIEELINPQSNNYEEDYSLLTKAIDDWPRAINPDLICQKDSEPDKEYRAESIIEFVITDYLKDRRFLDFGCGEGHVVAAAAAAGASKAVGYDLRNQGWDRFDQNENFFFTSDHTFWNHGPYDAILIFDVLDHIENASPEEILKNASNLLAPEGKIYLHCHPWCSRHGSHLYENGFNRAFAHLIMDDVELVRLGGYSNMNTLPIIHPVGTYRKWIDDSGLKIVSEQINEEKVEDFFFNYQNIWNRIHSRWNGDDPTEQLKISSIDYVLTSNTAQVF
jgi:2-polyprenyl-3-methyl-5-hydroxy-6-metoxy-1,4-benzoquinol methylase